MKKSSNPSLKRPTSFLKAMVALTGVSLLCPAVGCSHGNAPRYYSLDVSSYEGTLLSPSPEEDVDFSQCRPDPQKKTKCVVIFVDEFLRFKQDYLDLKNTLEACESR